MASSAANTAAAAPNAVGETGKCARPAFAARPSASAARARRNNSQFVTRLIAARGVRSDRAAAFRSGVLLVGPRRTRQSARRPELLRIEHENPCLPARPWSGRMFFESWVGAHLRSIRAGERRLLQNDPRLCAESAFGLASPDFADGGMMPTRCAGPGIGDNLSPALRWAASRAKRPSLRLSFRTRTLRCPGRSRISSHLGLIRMRAAFRKARSGRDTALGFSSAEGRSAGSAIRVRGLSPGMGPTATFSRCSRSESR